MKESNITSILSAFKKLPDDIFESYLNYFSIKIKKEELNDLTVLYNHLTTLTKNIELFDKYFIGYSIGFKNPPAKQVVMFLWLCLYLFYEQI